MVLSYVSATITVLITWSVTYSDDHGTNYLVAVLVLEINRTVRAAFSLSNHQTCAYLPPTDLVHSHAQHAFKASGVHVFRGYEPFALSALRGSSQRHRRAHSPAVLRITGSANRTHRGTRCLDKQQVQCAPLDYG